MDTLQIAMDIYMFFIKKRGIRPNTWMSKELYRCAEMSGDAVIIAYETYIGEVRGCAAGPNGSYEKCVKAAEQEFVASVRTAIESGRRTLKIIKDYNMRKK
ncbi:MAG: hypothetical protein FWG39_01745 [Alphaproteobacteria bacterium]|nr:hypothetical protein [Alphaproteobacteria bacterium]